MLHVLFHIAGSHFFPLIQLEVTAPPVTLQGRLQPQICSAASKQVLVAPR